MLITFLLLLWISSGNALLGSRFTPLRVNITSYPYRTVNFTTKVDHFSFTNDATFNMSYLINDDIKVPGSPIFFYTGNEGEIQTFAENTGFMWEIMFRFNATVVFAEHRFYGKSRPFGDDSFKDPKYFGYLTAEQALADFAVLINELKQNNTYLKDSPVIAFGGSYGGMLAAWFRQKYPNIVAGAIASSAPVWLFPGLSDCNGFFNVVTQTFRTIGSDQCVLNIQDSWTSISNAYKGPDGPKLLSVIFKLKETLADVQQLIDFLSDFYGTLAMVNYPYEASFIAVLPANPVKEFCSHLGTFDPQVNDLERVIRLANAVVSLLNYSQTLPYIDLNGFTQGIDAKGWDIQTCMEMTTPMCANGKTDMFPPQSWNMEGFVAKCREKYHVTPRPAFSSIQFWGKDLRTATNIVFSNGDLDPWSAFGVLKSEDAPLCKVLTIAGGAHHLDLRAANQNDPPSVQEARAFEESQIKIWIEEWKTKYANHLWIL